MVCWGRGGEKKERGGGGERERERERERGREREREKGSPCLQVHVYMCVVL